jgi:Zn-dependent protease
VLLGEPPRTQYDLNFSLLGIPVRVHPMFWLIILMLSTSLHDAASLLTWIAAVFISMLVHEMGHALVMRAYGYRPWITLYAMGGLASYDPRYASSPKGSGPLGQVLISLAGPVAGFLLVGVLLLGLIAAGYGNHVIFVSPWGLQPYVFELPNQRLAGVLNGIFFVSLVWGMVNLLPVYPLDGGQIAREIFLKLSVRAGILVSLCVSIVAAVTMAVVAFVAWNHDWFVAVFFLYLAYGSYITLQAYRDRNLS